MLVSEVVGLADLVVGAFEEFEVETGLDEAEVVGGLELLLDVLLEWLVESDWVVDAGWLVDGGWLVDEDDVWVGGVLIDIVDQLNVGEEVLSEPPLHSRSHGTSCPP